MSKPRTGAPKRVAVGLLAGALAMFGVALAPPAGATATVTNERLAGATRYGTAAAIAADEAFTTPTTAIVATGENFPDALAASSLAGANAAAPIILTQTSTYTTEAKAGLAALKAKGVTAVTIVGGTSAVSPEVETAIKGDGFTVARVAGDDRYETAAAIAQAADAKSAGAPIGGFKTALIATGTNFPDALAGGPLAYANKLPLLLVNNAVPTDTSNALSTLGIKKVIILGGTAAVSTAVEGQLVAATGNPATRLADVNRYGTASKIGDYEITTAGVTFPATSAVLATGTNFPDALAAGPLGGQLKAPIVLTASLPAESQAFLDKYSSRITKLYVAGGTSAIDDATVTAATTAAQNTGNDNATNTTVTSLPELVSAAVATTVTDAQATAAQPSGTYVRYTFDEAVLSPTAANFKLYRSSGVLADTGTATGTAVEASGTSVLVRFPLLTTTASVADATVATVVRSAVLDIQGNPNPEGDAAVGIPATSSNSGAAGTTAAPDLVSIGGFRAATTAGQTAVDFTFDSAAFVQGNGTTTNTSPTGFSLIALDSTEIGCTAPIASNANASGGFGTGGNGTTVITTVCPGTLTAAAIARGTVNQGAVGNALTPTLTNVLSAADTATPNSTTPDLVSASFINGANGGADTVVYTFDQPITAASPDITRFCVYTGTPVQTCGGTAFVANGTNTAQVAVTFGSTAVDSAVGASVLDTAVTSATLVGNQQDEVGVANTFTTGSQTPGVTAAPDLTAVTISRAAADAFGNPGAFQATYTFDSSATTAFSSINANNFFLYLSTGVQLSAGTCVAGNGSTTGATNTVTCSAFGTGGSGVTAAQRNAELGSAVLGTVTAAAVTSSTGTNPEGGAPTTGGTGTAVNP